MFNLKQESKEVIQVARQEMLDAIMDSKHSIDYYRRNLKEFRKNEGDMRITMCEFMIEKFQEKEKIQKEHLREIEEIADRHWREISESDFKGVSEQFLSSITTEQSIQTTHEFWNDVDKYIEEKIKSFGVIEKGRSA